MPLRRAAGRAAQGDSLAFDASISHDVERVHVRPLSYLAVLVTSTSVPDPVSLW
jgi:hypothetical protein